MKTLEVVIKMKFLQIRTCKFFHYSVNDCKNSIFLKHFWKFTRINGNKFLKNWIISALLLEQWQKTQTLEFLFFFGPLEDWTNKFLLFTFFANWTESLNYVAWIWGISENFGKTENLNKTCHCEAVKNWCCSALFQRKSELKQRCTALIFSYKKIVFSAVQRFSGKKQRWKNPKLFWIRTLSLLTFSSNWSSLREVEKKLHKTQWLLFENAKDEILSFYYCIVLCPLVDKKFTSCKTL